MIDLNKMYSKKEAAALLDVSVYAINKAIRLKRLAFTDGTKLISGEDLQRYNASKWDSLRHKPVKKDNVATIDGVMSECQRIANFVGVRIEFSEKGYMVIYNNLPYADGLDLGCLLAFMQGLDMMYRAKENFTIPKYNR